MDKQDVLQLLRYYHHDFMNDLQVVQGYISMQETTKAVNKIDECVQGFRMERELMETHAPLLTLWMLQFNLLHTNIRLTYHINIKTSLQIIDQKLKENCQIITNSIINLGDKEELYKINISITEALPSLIKLKLSINGFYNEPTKLIKHIENIEQDNFLMKRKTESELTCEFSYSI